LAFGCSNTYRVVTEKRETGTVVELYFLNNLYTVNVLSVSEICFNSFHIINISFYI